MMIYICIDVPGRGLCSICDRHRSAAELFCGMWYAVRRMYLYETGNAIEPIFASGRVYIHDNGVRLMIGNYRLCQG